MSYYTFATVVEHTRLREGDLIELGGSRCRVVRVTPCCAVIATVKPARVFQTLAGKTVRMPATETYDRISANSEVPIISRRSARKP